MYALSQSPCLPSYYYHDQRPINCLFSSFSLFTLHLPLRLSNIPCPRSIVYTGNVSMWWWTWDWSWCLFLHFLFYVFFPFSVFNESSAILCLRHIASLLCSVSFVVSSHCPEWRFILLCVLNFVFSGSFTLLECPSRVQYQFVLLLLIISGRVLQGACDFCAAESRCVVLCLRIDC